jgi:hypothetical protein
MPLKFQPPNLDMPDKYAALRESLGPAIRTLPEMYLRYKIERQKLANELREHQSKYGTGAPAPTIQPSMNSPLNLQPGGPGSTLNAGPADEPNEDRINRLGTEKFNALKENTDMETVILNRDPRTGKMFDTFGNQIQQLDPTKKYQIRDLQITDPIKEADLALRQQAVEQRQTPVLPAGENKELTDMDSARTQLRALVVKAKEFGFGQGNPYLEKARTSKLNPLSLLDPKAQKFKQFVAQTKQIIGKGLEGGVLRKEDEYKYEAILPKGGDTEEIILGKVEQLDGLIADRQQKRLQGFSEAFRGIPLPSRQGTIQPREGPGQSASPDSQVPTPGTIEGGYRFKGGNPADPKNWEKI